MSMLARLRQIVQEVGSESDLESVLSLTVRRIRETMSTEVCSIYLTDTQTNRYVLRATEGLNQDAVGKVSLSSTEGIVGLVGSRAEPINLEDAFTHPSFVYLQSTGEERFHAFLGVPIIHQRKVHGVLVVQQREVRRFDESEEAFMVTLSAQLAGVIAHAEATGSILDVFAAAKQDDEPVTAKRFVGIAGAPGVAIGNVYVATLSADLRSVPDKPANDIQAELQDFEHALVQVREDIQKVSDSLATRLRTEEQALFEVYLRMLDDNAIPSEVRTKIEAGNWAQGALRLSLIHI